jgi:threonine dehydratase
LKKPFQIEKSVVEGAGAVGLAAFISGKLEYLKGKKYLIQFYFKMDFLKRNFINTNNFNEKNIFQGCLNFDWRQH